MLRSILAFRKQFFGGRLPIWAPFVLIGCVLCIVSSLIVYRFSPKSEQAVCAFRIYHQTDVPAISGDASRRTNKCVELEKASTNSARTLGLAGRESLPADQGMLFDFHQAGEYCMGIKDINFPLDMMWLNENREIIYMIEGITPDMHPRTFCGPREARYVVEVNTGIVKAADLRIGQRLKF